MTAIVACHNYGRFLPDAVTSLQNQTRRPDEIIITDDGSTDDSWPIMSEIAESDPTVKLIRHTCAHGVCETVNEMVAAAAHELIQPLSADDKLTAGVIEASVNALVRSGASFAYTGWELFGTETGRHDPEPVELHRMLAGNQVHGTAMFRRDMFLDLGGYDTDHEVIGAEDWDFWLRALAAGHHGVPVPGEYVLWRQHGKNRNRRSRGEVLRLRAQLLRRHRTLYLSGAGLRAAQLIVTRSAWR